ncbi:uncharacterized protein LOC120171555 [Hibiscus syriacus]|uniref:uncharacterized protein LOC120171555 n=1 Tax=Hibiscus syriacus TaxID=106335 RepID=UPI0019249045|nr:uncharacterized protein LOC120171555 [Hibiscus syriacus]
MTRKRKNNGECDQECEQVSRKLEESNKEEDEDFLELTLCNGSLRNAEPPSKRSPTPPSPVLSLQPSLSSQQITPLTLPPQQPPLSQQVISPILSLSSQQPPSPPPNQVSRPSIPQQFTQQMISSSFALRLSNSHPLFNDETIVSHSSSSVPLFYPQESVSPLSPAAAESVPISSTGTGTTRGARARSRNSTQAPREGKIETITPPFPWATEYRATVHTLNHLLSQDIFTITGEVQCKRCERKFETAYDLEQKFNEIGTFIAQNRNAMHDRAPEIWMNPALPKCELCNQVNSAKPLIPEEKESINWLFLFLGQMIGCCTLEQLKYFCKHTKNHCTGAKDRVVYLAYLSICKQLDPTGPFTR